MADLIKKIKIKKQDGTFTDYIPIGAEAQNISMNNGKSVQYNIGNIDVENDGSIAEQLENIDEKTTFTKTKVHYIYSGNNKGNCIVVETQNKNIMLDCGYDTTGNAVATYLQQNNITHIDYFLVTHFHGDHVGGGDCSGFINMINTIPTVFENCIGIIPHTPDSSRWIGTEINNIQTREGIIRAAFDTNINVEDNEILMLDDKTKLRFLNASVSNYDDYYDYTITGNGEVDTGVTVYNNFSLVTEMTHGENVFLFTGDIEGPAEDNVTPYLTKVEVYECEHHGANTNTRDDYLSKIIPKIAIVCNTENTRFDKKTLGFFRSHNIPLYSTNDTGSICVESDMKDIAVISQSTNSNILKTISKVNYETMLGISDAGLGISINEGEDLDNLVTNGEYYSGFAARTNTLINCPLTGTGFKLIVTQISNENAVRQEIWPHNGTLRTYVRMKYKDTTTTTAWTPWQTYERVSECYQASYTIPANADLNDYKTPGRYQGGSADILNLPNNNLLPQKGVPFKLIVEQVNSTGTAGTQILYWAGQYTCMFIRQWYNNSGIKWSNWEEITGLTYGWAGSTVADNTDLNTLINPGHYGMGSTGKLATLTHLPSTLTTDIKDNGLATMCISYPFTKDAIIKQELIIFWQKTYKFERCYSSNQVYGWTGWENWICITDPNLSE